MSLIHRLRQQSCLLVVLMGENSILSSVYFAYSKRHLRILFKGFSEIENLKTQIKNDLDRYVNFVQQNGYYAEGLYAIGVDVVDEIVQITLKILERFPSPVFFGGQLIFPNESFLSRMLHNYTVFAVQRRLYNKGIPVVIMPIRV